MKKKTVCTIIFVIVAAVIILFVPIRTGNYDDGGTKEYSALTYKVVIWNRYVSSTVDESNEDIAMVMDVYHKKTVYCFPDNFKSIGELWDIEAEAAGLYH